MQILICPKILIWRWRKQKAIYKDKQCRSLEVCVSKTSGSTGELFAYRIEPLFCIFALVHQVLPMREITVGQHRRGANCLLIPLKISAQKGRATACRVLAELQNLRF